MLNTAELDIIYYEKFLFVVWFAGDNIEIEKIKTLNLLKFQCKKYKNCKDFVGEEC